MPREFLVHASLTPSNSSEAFRAALIRKRRQSRTCVELQDDILENIFPGVRFTASHGESSNAEERLDAFYRRSKLQQVQ